MKTLNIIVMTVPFHYLGSSYWVLDMQGKKLGHIFYDEHPMYQDEQPGWTATGNYPGIHHPPMGTLGAALSALLLREHHAKPGRIYRMKASEEWTVQKKLGGKFYTVKEVETEVQP